jgi:O-antigen/teichoic acid export membrane protein
MFYLIPGFIYTSLFPFISKFIKDEDEKRLSVLLRKSIIVSLGLALPITIGGLIIAGPLMNVVYGHDYIGATRTFQILLLTLLPIFPGMILSSTLLAEDKQKTFIKSSAVGAGANIVLDLILIPIYGIAGSAVATIIAQLAVNGIFLSAILKNHALNIWKDMRKITLASGVMALLVFAMTRLLWPLLVIVPLSAILYFGLLFILREEVLQDIRQGFKI